MSDEDCIQNLKLYVRYMENVMDHTWEEARMADINGILTPTWRSTNLDNWLVMEYVLMRHNMVTVERYNRNGPTGNCTLNDDPLELGTYSPFNSSDIHFLLYTYCIFRLGSL